MNCNLGTTRKWVKNEVCLSAVLFWAIEVKTFYFNEQFNVM